MRARVIAVAAVVTAALAGCLPPETDNLHVDPCASLPTDGPPDDAPRVAILVDASASTRSTIPDLAYPDYGDDLFGLVEDAVRTESALSVGSFGGSGSVTWTIDRQSTTSGFNSGRRQETQRINIVECINGQLPQAVATPPTSPGSDILAAMRAARDRVGGTTATTRIVVATDGLATTGCASLVNAGFAADGEIDAIVDLCLQRSEINEGDLAGIAVTMVGIGYPAPDAPAPTPAQREWLVRLWTALCQAGGGTCDVTTEDPGRAASDAPPPSDITDPTVGFSTTWRFLLPDAALFDVDQWQLRPGAERTLIRVAVAIRTLDYVAVHVFGHADETGEAGYNLTLSQNRADTVMRFLQSNGIQYIDSVGRGETEPLCTQQPPDEHCLQLNRRVEIVAEQDPGRAT